MIVKVIKHFGDKETGATYAEQIKREVGNIFECSDELANERIEKGFVKKASAKEIKEYEKNKAQFAVTQEDDGNVHVRPVVDGEIVDTPVEQVITNKELKNN